MSEIWGRFVNYPTKSKVWWRPSRLKINKKNSDPARMSMKQVWIIIYCRDAIKNLDRTV